ncbi:MAG: lysophospholipase [Desulfurispora sp.]|uniref:alpha/beta hydrolase n=1 Tax=Desulfurispora sp. TaxID=3014275 RepID=UPI00404B9A2B
MAEINFALPTPDGLSLAGRAWQPEAKASVVLCLVHGLGEHSGRYAALAEFFTHRDCSVVTFDQRGFGRSPGPRGFTPSYKTMLDDIALLLQKAQEMHPSKPLFLYGHSMGGNLVINYALSRRPSIAGVIASAPWLELAFQPPKIKMALARAMDKIWPSLSQPSGLDPAHLSRDPEVVRAYLADPLVHDRITPRLFLGCYQAGLWAQQNAPSLSLPLLLLHGSGDRLTSFAASREFARRAGKNCTFLPWEGLYHELHHEREREQVLESIWQWMQGRL